MARNRDWMYVRFGGDGLSNAYLQGVEEFIAFSFSKPAFMCGDKIRCPGGNVGNRLLSATVEYEETGWYDGQIWVKTAEVLARDRLLGSFSVKPVLSRLKYSLVTLAASLFISILLFINVEGDQKVPYSASDSARERAIPGVYSEESAKTFEPDDFCGEPEPEPETAARETLEAVRCTFEIWFESICCLAVCLAVSDVRPAKNIKFRYALLLKTTL